MLKVLIGPGFRRLTSLDETGTVPIAAVVVKAKDTFNYGTYVHVVTHNNYRLELLELNFDDFSALYQPMFDQSGLEIANELYAASRHIARMPDAEMLLREFIKTQAEERIVNTDDGHINGYRVHQDFNRRTCIEVERAHGHVKFIPLSAEDGLQVETAKEKEFDQRFKSMVNYPVKKAARLYVSYAANLGCSKAALEYLGKIIVLSPKEIEMAEAKNTSKAAAKSAAADKAARTATPKKADSKTTAKPAAKATAKPTSTKPKAAAAAGEKRESASQLFRDLIMEGKHTDDQIFAKVQAKYGLTEDKRSYVKWYRNDLAKKGMNPPAAKA